MENQQTQNVTETPATQPNTFQKKKLPLLNFLPVIICAIGLLYILGTSTGILGGNKAEDAAEKYVNRSVYSSLGVVPNNFKSETIYRDGKKRLIEVKYGLDSNDWDGTYCVYTNGEYVVNCTEMLGAGFDCESNLSEIKALFGL